MWPDKIRYYAANALIVKELGDIYSWNTSAHNAMQASKERGLEGLKI